MLPSAFSGVFIGSRSLLIRCAERFVEHGNDLRAIVSLDSSAQRWAEEHGVPCIAPSPELAARLAQEPFDYLFSVVHLAVIPADVLAQPRRAAINFHDGPLPEYAGLNVTSWALLNREQEHGVTWHLMTERVDEGDILEEVRFPIGDDETALTLNAKCYEAAVESFEKLLTGLSQGTIRPRRQDVERRGCHMKDERPWAAGSLDGSRPAAELSALVRALEFGPYANPLTTAKIWLGEAPVAVRHAEVLGSGSRLPAGTVTRVGTDSITVATGTQDLLLGGFATLLGAPLETRDLEARYGLEQGISLSWPRDVQARALTALTAGMCRHEEFWLTRLAKL